MNMTGFQNNSYGVRADRPYPSKNLSRSSTQLPGEASGASFSAQAAAHLKMEYPHSDVDRIKEQKLYMNDAEAELRKEEMERYLFFHNTGRFRAKPEDEHVLFQPEKKKTGVFSEKTLAEAAGYKPDYETDWESDGMGSLTEEQIQYLKEKYDVEDLAEADYYNLLAELTQMNVLSGKDVERQFVRPLPPCTAIVSPGWKLDEDEIFEGNYLKKLKKELDETEVLLSMLKEGKCSVSPENALGAVRAFYEKEQEYHEKMAGIFRQLQRGDSKS